MAGNRKKTPNEDVTAAEADFFGEEDLDWLTDEIPIGAEAEASPAVEPVEVTAEQPETLEVAPPPVAPVEPVDGGTDEAAAPPTAKEVAGDKIVTSSRRKVFVRNEETGKVGEVSRSQTL